MPKISSWWRSSLLVFLLAVPAALPIHAATIAEKTVMIEIEPSGEVVERHGLRVVLETSGDLDAWESYAIATDEHSELVDVDARAVHADGAVSKVRRKKDRDTVEASVGASFYDSRVYELLTFSDLREGSQIELDYVLRVRPYHPSSVLALRESDAVRSLRVEIRGAGGALRWRLDGPQTGLIINETADGLVITASDLPKVDPPDAAPGGGLPYTVLRYGWSGGATWNDIGRWYGGLLAPVSRNDDAVRARARELIAEIENPRARLEALTAFLRRKVRYVAVEVGIGGFRPSAAAETLERGWGDCKDKSLLLIDLLREAGIPARPALILLDDAARVDPDLPTPFQFNHLIVAVPESAVALEADDPVRDGYFFIDPTQTRGAARWLHPGVQDQRALVVGEDGGELVRTPLRPEHESRELNVQFSVTPEGHARGGAGLTLGGSLATAFIEQISTAPAERTEEIVRGVFAALLPGVEIGAIDWKEIEGDVPKVDLVAAVRVDGLVQGLDTAAPSFSLDGLHIMPSTELFDERELPLVAAPRELRSRWTFTLPEAWCLPEESERVTESELGTFRQGLVHGDAPGRFTLERDARLEARWVELDEMDALKELAVAERRAHRRRIRLKCEG